MKKLFFIILMFAISQTLFAAFTCPPISTIKSVKFYSAKKIPWVAGSGRSSLWMVSSDSFTYQGEAWNLLYNFATSATNQAQVIQDGTTHLNQKRLIQPIQSFEKNQNVCTYTSDKDVETVTAFNPPLTPMSDSLTKTQNENVSKPPAKDIQGNWHNNQSQTSIKLNQPSYTFCNEVGNCANGFWSNGYIQVPQWNVTGTLSSDGNSIDWSNSTRWQRH
jgi:hypothetical protein